MRYDNCDGLDLNATSPQYQPVHYRWDPKRKRFSRRFLKALPIYRHPDNFADPAGPITSTCLLERRGYWSKLIVKGEPVATGTNLVMVGSVLHFGKNGDMIWGSGRNGKIKDDKPRLNQLDIRIMRGPLAKILYKIMVFWRLIFLGIQA